MSETFQQKWKRKLNPFCKNLGKESKIVFGGRGAVWAVMGWVLRVMVNAGIMIRVVFCNEWMNVWQVVAANNDDEDGDDDEDDEEGDGDDDEDVVGVDGLWDT